MAERHAAVAQPARICNIIASARLRGVDMIDLRELALFCEGAVHTTSFQGGASIPIYPFAARAATLPSETSRSSVTRSNLEGKGSAPSSAQRHSAGPQTCLSEGKNTEQRVAAPCMSIAKVADADGGEKAAAVMTKLEVVDEFDEALGPAAPTSALASDDVLTDEELARYLRTSDGAALLWRVAADKDRSERALRRAAVAVGAGGYTEQLLERGLKMNEARYARYFAEGEARMRTPRAAPLPLPSTLIF